MAKPKQKKDINFMSLSIRDMTLALEHLPVKKGLNIVLSIKSIILIGSPYNILNHEDKKENSLLDFPILIEPIKRDQIFADMLFEINPTDDLNKRIKLKTKSLKLIYDATTINNIVYFFRSTESLQKKKLKNAALRTISRVKEHSIMYMKNNLQNIEKIDLNIDIDPSFIILSQDGIFKEDKKSLFIDLGSLSFRSAAKQDSFKAIESNEDNESFHSADEDEHEIERERRKKYPKLENNKEIDVIEASYVKYKLKFEEIKILLIDNSDFKVQENKNSINFSSECNVLTPINLYFNFDQCVYKNDPKLPAFRLSGNYRIKIIILLLFH